MKLYANAAGELVAVAVTVADEAMIGAPAGVVETLTADGTTNAILAADLLAAPRAYRLSADALTKDGVVVPINAPAPSPDADIQAVLAVVADPDAQAALARILTRALGGA